VGEVAEDVELVANVAVGWPPILREVEEVEAAVGEGIAFVRIVVLVLRQDVIGLDLVTLREALAQAERHAAVA
jgi:hypothetical protein